MTKPPPSQWKQAALSGAAAASLSRTILAPIERIKLIVQLNSSSTTTFQNLSALAVAQKVYHEQGLLAFWRGNAHSMVRVAGTAAINFTCMDYYKRLAMEHGGMSPGVALSLAAGGSAGLTATTLLYPIEFLRTRIAMETTVSSRAIITRVFQKEGVWGFYQGFGVAAAGGVIYRIVLLGGYDAMKEKLQMKKGDIVWMDRYLLAQCISLSAATIAYPFDSMRRRLMMQAGEEHKYRNFFHCGQAIVTQEGFRGFYRGFGVNMIRSVSGALLLVFYDSFRSLLG